MDDYLALTLGVVCADVGDLIVGATIFAIGTSVPELATTIIAKLRGHDEIGLGTILGSNIFNGIFIVAVAAVIHPITAAWGITKNLLQNRAMPIIFQA